MYTAESGDMWTVWGHTDKFIITTNAIVKRNGGLVMGAGIAKQARDRWPGLDVKLGRAIQKRGTTYGVILGKHIGIFQVKHHYRDAAQLDLIAYSADMLSRVALAHPDCRYDMNFPGIGNGKLKFTVVQPLLKVLPVNVHVWTF